MNRFLIFFFLFSIQLSFAQDETSSTPCNCCKDAYQQFDFWLGAWEVFDPKGIYVGQNSIQKIDGACAFTEQWVGAKGFTGSSLNFYDKKTQLWHQHWVDKAGNILNLSGQFKENTMTLISEELYSEKLKTHYQNRISWTKLPDGSVRQHWEKTTDKGTTWKTVFDGIYKKKE